VEKIVELLGKLLPLLRYYPRWSQILFAAALALLLVCVFVAVVGYSTASKERASCEPPGEVTSSIEHQVSQSQQLYKQLGISLSNWYVSVISLRSDLLQYTEAHPEVRTYVEQPLPADLQGDEDLVIANFGKVRDALMAVHNDDFAARCWQAGAATNAGFLASVRTSLMNRGYSESEASVQAANIPYLSQFFSLAAQRLSNHKFGPLLQAVLTTDSADIAAVGKNINNENLRTFLIGGNLLFGFVQPKKDGSILIASWGTAMISDIFKSTPDAKVVRAQLESAHPEHRCYVKGLPLNIDRNSLVDEAFAGAIQDLEKRQDLLVFEIPPNVPTDPVARHSPPDR
jgi:hypothetical protein